MCIYNIYIYIFTYNHVYGDEHRRLADNVLKHCSIHFGNGKLMNISCHFLGGYVSPYIQQSTSADQLFALSIQSYLAPQSTFGYQKNREFIRLNILRLELSNFRYELSDFQRSYLQKKGHPLVNSDFANWKITIFLWVNVNFNYFDWAISNSEP